MLALWFLVPALQFKEIFMLNIIRQPSHTITSVCLFILAVSSLNYSKPAYSSDAGAFLGGMVTSKVLNNMSRRTQAEEAQAYNSSQATQQAAAQPAQESTQQKLDELDKLAAGGYITKDEYKAKRKAIIDSM
jgi:hypothetical protein